MEETTEPIEEKVEQSTEKDIVDTLFNEKDTYQKANQQQRAEFNEIYNVYIGKMDNVKKLPYKTKESSSKLRTEIAYVVPSIYSGQPEVEVEGVGEEDKAIAKIIEKMVNYRFQTIPQFDEKIEAWVKQSVTFGTSVIKVCWKFETKDNGDGTVTPIKDEPDLELPNLLDTFYNPIISEVENQPSLIFRSILPINSVKNNPIYDFVGEEGLNRERITEKGSATTDQYTSTQQQSSDLIDIQKAGKGTIEVYERITKEKIQTVVDGKDRLVLRDKPYLGFINAVKLTHEPNCIPNRFEGWGVGHNTMGIGKLYYRMWNQTIEGVKMTNNPMFIAKKGKSIDPRQAVAKPGGILFLDDDGEPIQNSLQVIQFPDTKQGADTLLSKLEDEHRRASGANDLVQGAASNKTLGQDQIASTYSSQRFELIQRRFKQALSDLANMIIKMDLQNLQSIDAPILKIFPEEIRQDVYQLLINEAQNITFNVKIKGETNVAKNKDIQIKQLIDTYNLFGVVLPPENQMAWARKILELRGVDELDKLVPSAEQMIQIQQQQMMAAQDPSMMGQGTPAQPTEQIM